MSTQTLETDPSGIIFVITREEAGAAPHRRPIVPGAWIARQWSPSDLSGETEAIQEAANAAWTQEIVEAFKTATEPAPLAGEDVNAERDRRIVAGKTINGVAVTGRDEDARNLTNLALAAQLRIASGDTTTLTTFRDGNNVDHDLTPAEMLALWQASAAYVSDLYAASWIIKALDPIPADYTDDARWPAD